MERKGKDRDDWIHSTFPDKDDGGRGVGGGVNGRGREGRMEKAGGVKEKAHERRLMVMEKAIRHDDDRGQWKRMSEWHQKGGSRMVVPLIFGRNGEYYFMVIRILLERLCLQPNVSK